jgi:gas vesicle protein
MFGFNFNSSGSGGFDWGGLLGGIVGSIANVYAANKSYSAQKDAAEIQREASQEQVKAAGFQEQMAGEQEQAAMEAQRLAELNAVDAQVQNAREQENLRLTQAKTEGENRARAAASGVTLTGSTGAVLEEQKRVAGEKMGWLEQVGQSEVREIRAGGEAAKSQGLAQAMGTRAQAAGTKAASKTTKAGAYQSALGGINSIFQIGASNKWF